jgi:hypothetical protein
MKNILLFLFVFPICISAQTPDQHIPWGETDSTSYVVIKNGKFGMVMEGKQTIEPKYEIENLMTAINWDGNAYFSDGADFVLGLDGKWGVMNNRGVIKVPFEYDYIRMERENDNQKMACAGVEKNGKIALMDNKGKLLTGFEFDKFLGYYHYDYQSTTSLTKMAIEKEGKIFFYDASSKKIFPSDDDVNNTPESKIVSWKNKMGVINRSGQIVLPFDYDHVLNADAAPFENKFQPLKVIKDGKTGIWLYGRGVALPVMYDDAEVFFINTKPYFIVKQNDLYALFNSDAKNLTGFIFTGMYADNGMVKAQKGDAEFMVSPEGVVEPEKK